MNLRKLAISLACTATLFAAPAVAQSTFQTVSGKEFLTGHVEGVVNCRGSVPPTGDFFAPCGAGVPGSVRDRLVYALVVMNDPLFSGTEVITSSFNFDANGEGPMWGTFELHLAGGGTVAGSFSGRVHVPTVTLELDAVAHGSGGVAEGLQFKIADVHSSPPPTPGDLLIRVLNPGGKH
jgi:hypothetical protein